MSSSTTPAEVDLVAAQQPRFDERAPGERYYRHPGDVVRVVAWGAATVTLVLLIELAEGTNAGLREDLGEAAGLIPLAVRQLAIAVAQVAAVLSPLVVAACLVSQRRWRRTVVLLVAAAAGAVAFVLIDRAIGVAGPVRDALDDESWLISTRFPSPSYLAAVGAATIVGKPWLSSTWRRAANRALLFLLVTMIIAGTSGLAELLLALTTGCLAGAAVLVAVGAPNRRPSPLAVAEGLRRSGLDVTGWSSSAPWAAAPRSIADRWPTALRSSSRSTRGQPRRRSALPRRSRAAPSRSRRRLASGVARTRGRARRTSPAPGAAGRGELPRAPRPHVVARWIDGLGHGRCRRASARLPRSRRDAGRTARCGVAGGADTAPGRARSPGIAGGQHRRHRRRPDDRGPRRERSACR